MWRGTSSSPARPPPRGMPDRRSAARSPTERLPTDGLAKLASSKKVGPTPLQKPTLTTGGGRWLGGEGRGYKKPQLSS